MDLDVENAVWNTKKKKKQSKQHKNKWNGLANGYNLPTVLGGQSLK